MNKTWLPSVLLFVGLLVVFAGERIVEPTSRTALTLVGLALVLGATVLRGVRLSSAVGDRKAVERALFGLCFITLAGLALYFAQSDVLAKIDGKALDQTSPKLAGAVSALWPALLLIGLFPTFLMELAYSSMSHGPIETGRVRDAMLSGLGFAFVFVFAFTVMYVATERDSKWDLSYFRTARPGEASRKIVRALDEPVQISLFFPPANEVAAQVDDYFDDLKAVSPKLEVARYDQAIDPVRARELGVSVNGTMVIAKGTQRELVNVGLELEKARGQLRNLDREVQQRLLMVARSRKNVYYTAGHGERSEDVSPDSQRLPISVLMGELRAQNYELRPLTGSEGLGAEVPKDAAAVLVLGPTLAFTPPELASLSAYVSKGGRLLIALDPEAGLSFKELLNPLGVSFSPVILANDVAYARKNYQPSDKTIIGTAGYSSHPSVTTNGRMNFPMFMLGAGIIQELPQHPAEIVVDFAVRAHPQTWNDLDGNFDFNPPVEKRDTYGVAAAVTLRSMSSNPKPEEEGRAIVLADSDGLTDEVLQGSRGNGFFVVDGLKWLLGDEAISGETTVEQDAPIVRTRKQDVAWFYSTIFLAPAAVVLAGYLSARRTKVKPRPAAKGQAKEGTS